MKLLKFIFLSSAFGAVPVALRLDSISLSGLITVIICLAAILAFTFKPFVARADMQVLTPLVLFCVWSSIWFICNYDIEKQPQNYLVVWLGILFIFLYSSGTTIISKAKLISLDQTVYISTLIYFVVQLSEVLTKTDSPATTQVGLVFFSFQLVKLFNGERRALFFLLGIICMQIMLGARIVVLAEMFMLSFGKGLITGFHIPRISKLKWSGFITASILVGAIVYAFNSGIATKTFGGGDRALVFHGTTINTSGRMYMWNIVVESSLESPWLGHGTPGPKVMLRTARWSHPHNDYLRLFHQLGLVGLVLWLLFVGQSLAKAWCGARYLPCVQARSWCHATFLAIIGLSIMMVTDNSIVYSYVVYPVSVMIGITLALQHNRLRCEDNKNRYISTHKHSSSWPI